MKGVPFYYALEQLAQRWHVAPWEIEAQLDDPLVQRWLHRGLIFSRLENVEVRNTPR